MSSIVSVSRRPCFMNLMASCTRARSRYSTSGASASATSSLSAAIPTDSAITLIDELDTMGSIADSGAHAARVEAEVAAECMRIERQ